MDRRASPAVKLMKEKYDGSPHIWFQPTGYPYHIMNCSKPWPRSAVMENQLVFSRACTGRRRLATAASRFPERRVGRIGEVLCLGSSTIPPTSVFENLIGRSPASSRLEEDVSFVSSSRDMTVIFPIALIFPLASRTTTP